MGGVKPPRRGKDMSKKVDELRKILGDEEDENKIIIGDTTYGGVILTNDKLTCSKCKKVEPKAKMVCHMDGTDFYSNVFQCECGNQITMTTKRSGEDAAFWR